MFIFAVEIQRWKNYCVLFCKSYFIFFTNTEKWTYFLMHFLGVLHFFMYFFKFHVFFSNFTYFFQISSICKYVKSRICALGLHYEIREFAYFCPRTVHQKCNFDQFFKFSPKNLLIQTLNLFLQEKSRQIARLHSKWKII